MGKTATIMTASDASDVQLQRAWGNTKMWLGKVNQATTSQPNAAKLKQAMTAARKELIYEASLSSDNKTLTVTAKVGGKVVETMVTVNLAANGQKKWREALEALAKDGKVFSTGDLKTWDDKNPSGPTSSELKKKIDDIENQLKLVDTQIKRLQDAAKPKLEELKKLREELKRAA